MPRTPLLRPVTCVVAALLVLASAACGSTSSSQERIPVTGATRPAATFSDWPAYHGDAAHSGHVDAPAGSPLHTAWTADLDGAVYGEPLVVGDTLVVATEEDKVYGLDATTGAQRWSVSLGRAQPQSGLPCGNIDPLGITGTPAYDAATGSVFVVAETVGGVHTLWAVDAANGQRRWHRVLDVLPERNKLAEQQRSAVLVTHGRVVVAFGGLAGDCDNYVGYLTSTAVGGKGAITSYAVPTAREAGMWSPAGPIEGPDGQVYVASGNGAELHGQWDLSDSVTELDPATLERASVFAPSTWADDNVHDLDLGSSSPAWLPSLHRLVIAGKRGTVYLLPEHPGGIGSDIASLDGCTAFGGAAVVGATVLMPCQGESQLRALQVTATGLSWAWSADDVTGSPVVAGQDVYVTDGDAGDLVVLRLADGRPVQRIHAGDLTHFPSQVVDGGYVFVPTLEGVTAFHR